MLLFYQTKSDNMQLSSPLLFLNVEDKYSSVATFFPALMSVIALVFEYVSC